GGSPPPPGCACRFPRALRRLPWDAPRSVDDGRGSQTEHHELELLVVGDIDTARGHQDVSVRVHEDADEKSARGLDGISAVALIDKLEALPALHQRRVGMEDGGDAGDAGAGKAAVRRQIFLDQSASAERRYESRAVGGL